MIRPSLPYQGLARKSKEYLENLLQGTEPSYERDIDVSATVQNQDTSIETVDTTGIMEIGGFDIIIETDFPAKAALKKAIEIIEGIWKDCSIEFLALESFFAPGEDNELHEVFVYKTEQDIVSWSKNGCTPENKNCMIHLLSKNYKHQKFTPNELTCVIGDDKDPELCLIVENIRKGLG